MMFNGNGINSSHFIVKKTHTQTRKFQGPHGSSNLPLQISINRFNRPGVTGLSRTFANKIPRDEDENSRKSWVYSILYTFGPFLKGAKLNASIFQGVKNNTIP